MKLILKFITALYLNFFCLQSIAGVKNITSGPDIIVKGAYFFTLNEENKKVYFDLEIQNIGNEDAVIDSFSYNCSLYDGEQNGIIRYAGGQKLRTARFVLEKGKSIKFERVWFTYNNLELKKFPYLYITPQPYGLAEDNITNNKYLTRHLYPRQPSEGATQSPPNTNHPPEMQGGSMYPDLVLSVSNVVKKNITNRQTNNTYLRYTFTCTIKNKSNYPAIISNEKTVTIQSFSVRNCDDTDVDGAGGRLVLLDRTQINPGETIVLRGQTANQPVQATTQIRVELIYNSHEDKNNTANNKVCIGN